MCVSLELVVSEWVVAGLDEDSLHDLPVVVVVGRVHAVHLTLPADGVAVLLARHAQEGVGAHVLEAHGLLAVPVAAAALHRPHVQVVALAVLAERAHFLSQKKQRETRVKNGQQKHLVKMCSAACIAFLSHAHFLLHEEGQAGRSELLAFENILINSNK